VSNRPTLSLRTGRRVQAGRSGASSECCRRRLAPTADSLGRAVPTTPFHCGFRNKFLTREAYQHRGWCVNDRRWPRHARPQSFNPIRWREPVSGDMLAPNVSWPAFTGMTIRRHMGWVIAMIRRPSQVAEISPSPVGCGWVACWQLGVSEDFLP